MFRCLFIVSVPSVYNSKLAKRILAPRYLCQSRIRYGRLRLQAQRKNPGPDWQAVVLFIVERRPSPNLCGSFLNRELQHRGCLQLLFAGGAYVIPAARY